MKGKPALVFLIPPSPHHAVFTILPPTAFIIHPPHIRHSLTLTACLPPLPPPIQRVIPHQSPIRLVASLPLFVSPVHLSLSLPKLSGAQRRAVLAHPPRHLLPPLNLNIAPSLVLLCTPTVIVSVRVLAPPLL